MNCAFCERPLICDGCQAAYTPPTAEDYNALSWTDVPVSCPACGEVLVCHWCKVPYDGRSQEEADAGEGTGA
jgi:hypothetical protein